jgi:hypothetical protein
MSVKITGLKNLEAKLKEIGDRARELDGKHDVLLSELLSQPFLAGCSRFSSVDELFKASGFSINSAEDFKAIPDDKWAEFIRENTTFADWSEMLTAASAVWTKGRLGL